MKLKDTFTVILFNPLGMDAPDPNFTYCGVPDYKSTDGKIAFTTFEGRRVISTFKYLVVQEVEKDEDTKA